MSQQVVQTTCPGCKATLRVPGEMLNKPIRCKGCGTVMQARKPASPSTPTPPPVPAPSRKKAAPPAPPPAPAAIRTPPVPAPVAAPVAVARPVAPSRAGQAFAFDEEEEAPARSVRKPRHKRGSGVGGWITLGIVALLLVGGGIAVAVNWNRIKGFAANYDKPIPDPEPENPSRKDGKPASSDDGKPVSSGDGKPVSKGRPKPVAVGKAGFPRRALLISAHNYLYMNPITAPPPNKDGASDLARSLNRGLNFPMTQIVELSDAAAKNPRPPLKAVIEETIQNFLKTSRKQDRVMIVFAGHTAEADGKPYLVPLEGEKENVEGLIPVAWVLDQLAKADVKQKIFVLDGHRKNAAQGEERPLSGEMGEAFEKALSAPPPGVQVWAACGKGQVSNEYEEAPLGLFLDSFRQSLTPEQGERGALEGQIQSPEDPIQLERFHASVNRRMLDARQKVKQQAVLFGKEHEGGAPYDRAEAAAKLPALPVVKGADQRSVREVLSEISLPSLKGGEGATSDLQFGNLPPFPEEAMKKYSGTLEADSKLRQAVQSARATLWAISTATAPADIQSDVQAVRAKIRVDLSILRDRYNKPAGAGEMAFKASFNGRSREVARIVARLEDELEKLKEAGAEKEAAPPRWQANYDYVLARFQAQLAYLEQYNSLLGQMQKELPPAEAIHSGWRVASNDKATDAAAKKYEKPARTLYGKVAESNARTPWEVLAKREKLTALGMEWQAF